MKNIKHFALSLIALLPLLSCGGCGGNATAEPTPTPEPEPDPTPETCLTVTVRSTGTELTSFDTDYKAVDEILVIKSNKNWTSESTADWVRIEKGTGVLSNLVLDLNITGKERKATLTVKTEDNAKTLTIPVTQGVTDKIAKSDFCDMLLLETDRPENEYKGFMLYDKDGRVQWLFDAFIPSRLYYNGQRVGSSDMTKDIMTAFLDDYFEDGQWLSSIDKAAEGLKSKIPGKFYRRKILMAIPSTTDKNWGEVDGVALHPSDDDNAGQADRVAVSKWFVDETLDRFARKDYGNLQLIGFYWQEEAGHIGEENGMKIADYVHSYGLNFYWIPWFNSYNNTSWKKYGFDAAWLQPNYLFYEEQYPDKSQLYKAYDKATANGMYLEMELDNLRSLQRQIDYWDVYEEKGVLKDWPLTYYMNGSMFPSRDNISDPDWKAFHQRMAKDIADRQKRFYNYE